MSNAPSIHSTPQGSVAEVQSVDSGNDLTVAGVIGVEMLGPLLELRKLVEEAVAAEALDSLYASAMEHTIDQAVAVARRSQQLDRVSVRKAEQARERFALHTMLRAMCEERDATLRARGGQLSAQLHPSEVIEEPGLMATLLEASLDWAVERGDSVTVNLTLQDWPERYLLVIDSRQGIAPLRACEEDCLNWRLAGAAARTMGATLERRVHSSGGTLTICFPQFPTMTKRDARYSNLDFETRDDPVQRAPGGGDALRVLVVTADQHVREEVGWLCLNLRAEPKFVPDEVAAVGVLGQSLPQVVIADRPTGAPQPDVLADAVRRLSPATALVELVAGDRPLEMGTWGAVSTTRLNRDRLTQQLPSVLSLEIGRNS